MNEKYARREGSQNNLLYEDLNTSTKRTSRKKSGDNKIVRATDSELATMPGRWSRLYEPLYQLSNNPMSAPFLFPVHDMYSSSSLVGYGKVIKQPMDLRTILNKLLARQYSDESDVYNDLRLIWTNCELYNGSKHLLVAINAKAFSEEVDSLWHSLFPGTVAPSDIASASHSRAQSRKKSPEYDVLRERVKLKIETLQESDPGCMEELLEMINQEAPQAMTSDEEGDIILNLEEVKSSSVLKKTGYTS